MSRIALRREPPMIEPLAEHLAYYTRALAVIPEEFHASAYVAGSAASRTLRHIAWTDGGDFDVFVCGLTPTQVERLQMALRLAASELPAEPGDDDAMAAYQDSSFRVAYSRARLQIVLCPEAIEAVLARFDISCHAYAHTLLAPHVEIAAPGATRWTVDVLRWDRAHVTVYRALKLVLRYEGPPGMQQLWHHARFLQCVSEASGLTMVPAEMLTLVQGLIVQEGL